MVDYQPAQYWSERLAGNFNLRGTGHIRSSEQYNRWLYRAKRRALSRALGPRLGPVTALDIGSGVGWAVAQLLDWGATVEGCDIAEPAVVGLGARFPAVNFFVHALGYERLPRPPASYDLITLLDVAYHVTDDDAWEAGAADVARVLRSGGRLLVTDRLGDQDLTPAPHVRFRSMSRWLDVAAANGLDLVAVGPLLRWLSWDEPMAALAHLPDRARGAIEYGLELTLPRAAHLQWAIFAKCH
jgi:SAM-dependent methyltransferase